MQAGWRGFKFGNAGGRQAGSDICENTASARRRRVGCYSCCFPDSPPHLTGRNVDRLLRLRGPGTPPERCATRCQEDCRSSSQLLVSAIRAGSNKEIMSFAQSHERSSVEIRCRRPASLRSLGICQSSCTGSTAAHLCVWRNGTTIVAQTKFDLHAQVCHARP